jgi:plasmid stabilization system protein ParE
MEAVRWYEEHRRGLGTELFEAVSATLAQIQEHPEIGATYHFDRSIRRVRVPRFPYQVIYRLSPADPIIVLAFAHLKRRPNYWKGRT